MGVIEDKIASLGYSLPDAAVPVANYVPTVQVQSAGLIFTSGHVPRTSDGGFWTGKLGIDTSVEEGYEAAQTTVLSILGSLKTELGDLDRITRIVNSNILTGMVILESMGSPGFSDLSRRTHIHPVPVVVFGKVLL